MQQVAIVTGGASGIGLALGTALVQRGWHVVLDDIQDVKAKEEAERLTRAGPGTAFAAGVDVRVADPLGALVQDTYAEHGRLDLMVNNAGILVMGEPDELSMVHWDTVIDTNLRGVIHGCHAAYPLMKQQRFGAILNTASMAGLLPPYSTVTPYSTTKYGVVGLSLGLRSAGAEYGVKVSALCPGFIDTPMLDEIMPEGLPVPPSTRDGPTLRQIAVETKQTIYPAERLAEDTLAGLAKNKAVLAIPRQAQRYWLIARWMPGLAMQQVHKLTRLSRRDASAVA